MTRQREPEPVPDDLTTEQKLRLSVWVKERKDSMGWFDWIGSPRDLRAVVDECLAHHAAKGNPGKYRDWLAVCRKWLVKAQEIRERDRQAGRRESFVNLEPRRLKAITGGKS